MLEELDKLLRGIVERFNAVGQCLLEQRAALLVAKALERVYRADHLFVALPEIVVTQAREVVGFDLFVDVDPLAEHELAHATPLVGEVVATGRDGPQWPIGMITSIEVDLLEEDLWTLTSHRHE